jgi:MurNAc alpha-1-phosphate uridylyltransferase
MSAGPPEGLVGVVLAAGLGTRLRPLTELRTKALCPVDNVTLLDRAIARLSPYVSRIAVNAHHQPATMAEAVAGRAHLSLETPVALGTAGALGQLRGWIDGAPVLVTNADAYFAGTLDALVADWDSQRPRLLVHPAPGRGDFGDDRYSGSCLLPWSDVAKLEPVPTGLYEVMWRDYWQAGQLDLVGSDEVFIDCGTPAEYIAANLHASGGVSVVGKGAKVEGTLVRSVVWPGSRVFAGERLVDCIRAGDHGELTVPALVRSARAE